MYIDIWQFLGGLVHWLFVDIIGPIVDGSASTDWKLAGQPRVLNFVTILLVALIVFTVGMLVAITHIWQERKTLKAPYG